VPLVTEQNLSAHAKRLSGVYVMPDANIQHRRCGRTDRARFVS
jgi:hypothetical protein